MMGKWWEALSSSLEASHVISFLDSQAQWNIIKRGRNWNQKAPVAEQNQAVEKQKFKRCGFVWTE